MGRGLDEQEVRPYARHHVEPHRVLGLVLLDEAEHPAGDRLAVDALADKERTTEIGLVLGCTEDAWRGDADPVGERANRRLDGHGLDLDIQIGERGECKALDERSAFVDGVEQHVDTARTGSDPLEARQVYWPPVVLAQPAGKACFEIDLAHDCRPQSSPVQPS